MIYFFLRDKYFALVFLSSAWLKTQWWLSIYCLDLEIFETSPVPQNDNVPHVYWLFKII